jgi:hypothetical protein
MIKHLAMATAVAAALALAGPASATIHHLTYSGHVTEAFDTFNDFGAVPTLVGKAFIAHVTYDDAKPGAGHVGDVWYDDYGGAGAANPLTATVLLNGVTKSFGLTDGGDYRVDYSLLPGCTLDCTTAYFQQHAEDRYIQGDLYTLNTIALSGFSSDGTISGLGHAAPHFTDPPVDLFAEVDLFQQNQYTLELYHYAEVAAKIDSIREGVPEPDAWALLIAGFGLTGGALRRRSRAQTA